MTQQNPHRLPRHILPVHYELELEPDLDNASFVGEVSITLDIVSETDTVVLNAAELEIDNVWIEQNEAVQASSVDFDQDLERVNFLLFRWSYNQAEPICDVLSKEFLMTNSGDLPIHLKKTSLAWSMLLRQLNSNRLTLDAFFPALTSPTLRRHSA